MTLLRQIQDDAINPTVPVTAVLRKCKVLAARLGHRPLEEWVEYELNGYPPDAQLPPYRPAIPLHLRGNFINAAWKAEGIDVPIEALPKELREPPPTKDLRDPIGDIEELAASEKGVISFSLPAGLRQYVKVFELMQCYALWGEVSTLVFKNVLDQVRNRILTFALEIERENPEAGEAELGSHPVATEKVSSITMNTFYGGTNTLALDSPGAVQTVTVGFSPGDLQALLDHLAGQGVGKDDLADLTDAIEADRSAPENETDALGERVKAWLGKMTVKAGTGAWQVGASTGANVLGLAIAKYYGII